MAAIVPPVDGGHSVTRRLNPALPVQRDNPEVTCQSTIHKKRTAAHKLNLQHVHRFEVKMFAYLKDRHGASVTVHAEPSVQSVLEALQQHGIDAGGCRLSVNLAFAIGTEILSETDELALIPPVSGG